MSDYLFIYTRAQAIEDNLLRDISEFAKDAGFKFPVAITQAAWAECIAVDVDDVAQDETGRTWDVLNCLRYAASRGGPTRILHFDVLVSRGGKPPRFVRLKAHCGPGDHGEPVITVMLPNED